MEEQLRIVAVGNDCGTLESLNNILEKAGYQVSMTGCGPMALAILEEFNPDLVVLNGSGLDCDGFKALLLIRQRWDVPVIMLSSNYNSALLVDALAMDTDDYVAKPFSREEFIAYIRAKLRRSLSENFSQGIRGNQVFNKRSLVNTYSEGGLNHV